MMDGAYPPGVSGKMIDDYFEGLDRYCNTCQHYDGEYCHYWGFVKDPEDECEEWEEC